MGVGEGGEFKTNRVNAVNCEIIVKDGYCSSYPRLENVHK